MCSTWNKHSGRPGSETGKWTAIHTGSKELGLHSLVPRGTSATSGGDPRFAARREETDTSLRGELWDIARKMPVVH